MKVGTQGRLTGRKSEIVGDFCEHSLRVGGGGACTKWLRVGRVHADCMCSPVCLLREKCGLSMWRGEDKRQFDDDGDDGRGRVEDGSREHKQTNKKNVLRRRGLVRYRLDCRVGERDCEVDSMKTTRKNLVEANRNKLKMTDVRSAVPFFIGHSYKYHVFIHHV